MVHKILFWGGFGIAVRLWQLGIQMRPLFDRSHIIAYPIYAAVGGGFGFWLDGFEKRQFRYVTDMKERLIEKRKRVAALEA
ncbi:hypothetical protein P152DRAFT_378484, partial [Eremomyces bilateralis CBS 781.70]